MPEIVARLFYESVIWEQGCDFLTFIVYVWDVSDDGVAEEALGVGCTESLRAQPAD